MIDKGKYYEEFVSDLSEQDFKILYGQMILRYNKKSKEEALEVFHSLNKDKKEELQELLMYAKVNTKHLLMKEYDISLKAAIYLVKMVEE